MNIALATQPGYDTKTADYFEWSRPEMLAFVPSNCHRVLDVGCGVGAFGESLKRNRNVEVWGVEPVESAAEEAASKLDRVIHGLFNPAAGLPAGTFDCVIFNDVLEHMFAPEEALRYARDLISPNGVVVASIPNIRNFPILWELTFHARWDYQESGILDKTHLRFFTKSSIIRMFEVEKYSIENIQGINAYVGVPNASTLLWTAYRLASAIFPKFYDMRYLQFAVVAKVLR